MSKSGSDAIRLSASPAEIRDAVRRMYTDPKHLRVEDPGQVEGNVVFTYLDAFDEDRAAVEELKDRYRRGGLGDTAVKRRLEDVLQSLLAPIRERRERFAQDMGYVLDILRAGSLVAREKTQTTLDEVKSALGVYVLSPQRI